MFSLHCQLTPGLIGGNSMSPLFLVVLLRFLQSFRLHDLLPPFLEFLGVLPPRPGKACKPKSNISLERKFYRYPYKMETVMRPACLASVLLSLTSCSAAYGQGQVLNRTLLHDGLTRRYTLYVPPSYTGEAAWPLVLNLHGLGGNAAVLSVDFRHERCRGRGPFLGRVS